MKRNNIIFGVVLVFIGIFLLLYNLDLIRWSIFDVAFDLWPLIFIALGASIVFNDKKTIKTLVWVGFLAIIIAYGFYLQYTDYQLHTNNNSDININSNSKSISPAPKSKSRLFTLRFLKSILPSTAPISPSISQNILSERLRLLL